MTWNEANITDLFGEEQFFDEVKLCWPIRPGLTIRIMANAWANGCNPQYDLLIGNTSFFTLPDVSQIRGPGSEDDVASDISASVGECSTQHSFDARSSGPLNEGNEPNDLGFRLSIAGLSPSTEKSISHDFLEDELTSEFYSNNMESLRHQVTRLLYDTEDLVSRAIVNALSVQPDSRTRSRSYPSGSQALKTAMEIEVEAIWDAKAWTEMNADYSHRPELADRKRMFLQKYMDKIFIEVRKNILTEEQAIQILKSTATVLGWPLEVANRCDAILLNQLSNSVVDTDLFTRALEFGEVVGVGILKGHGFGICRFCDEESTSKALEAAELGSFTIHGERPTVTRLEQPLVRRRPDRYRRVKSEPVADLEIPRLERQRSHQRNTISIDQTLITSFTGGEDVPPVTPDDSKSTLRPNVFSNIPARASSPVLGVSIVSPEGR